MPTQALLVDLPSRDKVVQMWIKCLKIENFRGIRELEIDFDPRLTVLIGENGSGKTTILDALSEIFERLQLGGTEAPLDHTRFVVYHLDSSDIRKGQDFASVCASINYDAETVEGELCVSTDNSPRDPYIFFQNQLEERHIGFFSIYLPSGQYRSPQSPQSRASITEPGNSLADVESWWEDRDADEARIVRDQRDLDFRDPELEVMRELVQRLDHFETVVYRSSKPEKGLFFVRADGTELRFQQLSHGQQQYLRWLSFLGLAVSNARRRFPSVDRISGLALIDEIGSHLHPEWQNRIIKDLLDCFPDVQFIVATHSPLTLSNVEERMIRVLSEVRGPEGLEHKVRIPGEGTRGRSVDHIQTTVFGTSERSHDVASLIREFNDAYDAEDVEAAAGLLSQLEAIVEHVDADVLMRLRNLLRRMQGL